MAWRLAKSLAVLRLECNTYAPNRDKTNDGTIGDAAHASRASAHNPNNAGVVCALDITHDPTDGMDVHALARRLAKNPHPCLSYIVSNREICTWASGFKIWRKYGGSSPHIAHAHFRVGRGPDSEPTPPYDDTTAWGVAPKPAPEENDMTEEQDRLLRELKVSSVAHSFDHRILLAETLGYGEEAIVLRSQRTEAVAAKRKELGLTK